MWHGKPGQYIICFFQHEFVFVNRNRARDLSPVLTALDALHLSDYGSSAKDPGRSAVGSGRNEIIGVFEVVGGYRNFSDHARKFHKEIRLLKKRFPNPNSVSGACLAPIASSAPAAQSAAFCIAASPAASSGPC